MSWKGSAFGLVVLLAIGCGLVYLGWHTRTSSEMSICQVCNRPIHSETRTVALVDGKREEFCCPACALSLHHQTGKTVQVVELTDYITHAALSPENAFLVEGSDVNPCAQHDMLRDREGQSMPVRYDRCSPSILAFGNREDAQDFMRTHGGTLVSAEEFESRAGA